MSAVQNEAAVRTRTDFASRIRPPFPVPVSEWAFGGTTGQRRDPLPSAQDSLEGPARQAISQPFDRRRSALSRSIGTGAREGARPCSRAMSIFRKHSLPWSLVVIGVVACNSSDPPETACESCPVTAVGGATAAGGTYAKGVTPAAGGITATAGGATAAGGTESAPFSGGSGGTVATAEGGAPADTTAPEAGGTGPVAAKICDRVDGPAARALVADGAKLVDVRTTSEYASGHIEGSVNIPLADLAARLGELDLGRPIVVHCASGSRANQAATVLCDAGYTVHNLGPMSAW